MTRRAWIPRHSLMNDDLSTAALLFFPPTSEYASRFVEVVICPVVEAQPFGTHCSCYAYIDDVIVIPAPEAAT